MSTDRRAASPRWWLTRGVFAVVIGLAIAMAVDVARGGITAIGLRYASLLFSVPRGERIEIRPGHALYIDCRGEGTPTLVLEAGMGSDRTTWAPVHDRLAAITRTCSYDRAGRGRSDGDPAGDLASISGELTALLAASRESPPFVIVGHSYGTVIARVHTTRRPGEVVGLVLIDGFDPDIFDERVVPLLGPIREAYVDHTDGLWDLVASVESIDVERSRSQLAASDVGDIPLEVLVAPRVDDRLDAATNDAINASMQAGYAALSRGRVNFTLVWGAGHTIQFDRPEAVVEAVRRIVDTVRSGASAGAGPGPGRVPYR